MKLRMPKGPFIEHFPFCCTSAVLGAFGEHGEPSEVTVKEIKRQLRRTLGVVDLGGVLRSEHARCVFAISYDPQNIAVLKEVGFKEVDSYQGIQGLCRIFTLHMDELEKQPAQHMLEEGQV